MSAPDLMSQLQAAYANGGGGLPFGMPGANPGMNPGLMPSIPGMVQPLTAEQVNKMIEDRLAKFNPAPAAANPEMARLNAVVGQMEAVFQRALPAEQYNEFQKYVQAGGPGFAGILDSKALDPVVQMLWETIKENIK